MHHVTPENSGIDYVSASYQPDMPASNVGPPHSQYVSYMEHVPPSESSTFVLYLLVSFSLHNKLE